MDNENTRNTTEQEKSRRGFVKKSSAIAGISILPASNVWGTCNVSGVSGGSQSTNQTCVVKSFTGGYWPDFWEKLVQWSPDQTHYEALASLISDVTVDDQFTNYPHEHKVVAYYTYVRNLLEASLINVPAFGTRTPHLSLNVGEALRQRLSFSYNEEHLLATFCNALFGFANVEQQFTGHDGRAAFMQHIWGSTFEGDAFSTTATLTSSYTKTGTMTEHQLTTLLRDNGAI